MNIISINTASRFCSVTISLSNHIETLQSESKLSHSSELAVNVKSLIGKHNLTAKDLDFILVNIGPGSFTGLRIGVSFAKGLSMSHNIPIVPINSFDIILNKLNPEFSSFFICIHSHKNYAYAQRYDSKSKTGSPKLIDLDEKYDCPIYLSGLDSNSTDNFKLISFNSKDLIKIGKSYIQKNVISNLSSIKPIYIDYK